MVEPAEATYHLVLAVACMARGLTAEEANQVAERLESKPLQQNAQVAFQDLDEAVNYVRDKRTGRL